MKVCLIYKNSLFQAHVLKKKNKRLKAFIREKHPLIKAITDSHHQHLRSLEHVVGLLKKAGINPKISQRTEIQSLNEYDLIITIGGDGTLLRTCHHVQDQPVLGINSTPDHSVGALCSLRIEQFKDKLPLLLNGHYQIKRLRRMELKVNNTILPIEPINDVLFSNTSPAAMSRYIISFGRIKEEQKSSGIWVSTPAGSTAAINAAGGLKQHPLDTRLQYLTREPYQGTFNPYRLTRGFIKGKERLKLISKMTESKLYLDGPTRHHTLHYGDQISIGISKNFLNLVLI